MNEGAEAKKPGNILDDEGRWRVPRRSPHDVCSPSAVGAGDGPRGRIRQQRVHVSQGEWEMSGGESRGKIC